MWLEQFSFRRDCTLCVEVETEWATQEQARGPVLHACRQLSAA